MKPRNCQTYSHVPRRSKILQVTPSTDNKPEEIDPEIEAEALKIRLTKNALGQFWAARLAHH